MKIKHPSEFKAEVATASLNDIMFFLLLFFLIVSTLANPNVIKVLLPNAKSSEKIKKQEVSLTVTEEKKYFINQKEVAADKLEEALMNETKDIENPTVVLRVARNLAVQDLVDVLELGVRLNIKMMIATDKEKAG